jgi:hypothetical protein
MVYLSKRVSWNSQEKNSVPLMVDGMMVSHIPVDLHLIIVLWSLKALDSAKAATAYVLTSVPPDHLLQNRNTPKTTIHQESPQEQ